MWRLFFATLYDMATPITHDFIKFEVSHLPTKKYNAVLRNKSTGRELRVPFGAIGYEQYEDTTGVGAYSKFDHLDDNRRANYINRHASDKNKPYSASWFSRRYLW